MKPQGLAWLLGGSVALTVAALAGAETAGDEKGECTVNKDEVKTWITTGNGREYAVHPATPTYEGTTGLFHLPSAYTLPKGKLSFSLFRDNLDRDPKDEDISIHGLSLGFGVTNKLEIYGNFGLQNRVDADALFQPGFANDYPFVNTPWETGVGDVKLGLKYKLLDDYGNDPVGLAVRGFAKLPTADEAKGLGTGRPSYGADLLISKSLGRKADLHGSVGFQINSDPDKPRPVDIGNAVKWGVGLNVPACRILQLQAEVTGSAYREADFEQTNPVDLVVGPVIWIKPGLFVRAAISWNLNFDDRGLGSGSKSWTGRHISVGYHPGTRCCAVSVSPPPPPPPAANRPPTVACETDKSTAGPGETVRLRAVGSDPDRGDALTYVWSGSAGRVAGSGANATLDTAGVTPPATITVTVRVSDGRGGTAESACSVRIPAAERRPEAVTCVSGGFPRNMARLNNVDKACLDDVASRLRQDPRSRVIIVGHADRSERTPEVISRKRAEAVKTYLVKERGIEEARVTARGAGAAKALDLGTAASARARNRRVEVIFVPEGATAPE
jgi:outer membrane protein OmpA-like peptidoglycan-associated protein